MAKMISELKVRREEKSRLEGHENTLQEQATQVFNENFGAKDVLCYIQR